MQDAEHAACKPLFRRSPDFDSGIDCSVAARFGIEQRFRFGLGFFDFCFFASSSSCSASDASASSETASSNPADSMTNGSSQTSTVSVSRFARRGDFAAHALVVVFSRAGFLLPFLRKPRLLRILRRNGRGRLLPLRFLPLRSSLRTQLEEQVLYAKKQRETFA